MAEFACLQSPSSEGAVTSAISLHQMDTEKSFLGPPPFRLPLIGLPPIGLPPFGLTPFGLRGHLD